MRGELFAGGLVGLLLVVAALVVFVGPWPVVRSRTRTFERPLARARDEMTVHRWAAEDGGDFRAGWAHVPLTLPEGTPLAGYGDRRGAPAAGEHDQLQVSALVLGAGRTAGDPGSAGGGAAAIVTADLLVVPPHIAREVRGAVAIPVLFTATHTHSGPGAAMRGLVARAFGGAYRREVERRIAAAMIHAVERARRATRPVRVRHGRAEVPALIRNRTRSQTAGYPSVDSRLDLVLLEDDEGSRLSVLRFSAHPTILSASNMEFSAGYPGFLREAVARRLGGDAMYLAGSLGSMSPVPPEAGDEYESARAYGQALARALPPAEQLEEVRADTLSVAELVADGPPVQLRVAPRLRMSPIFLSLNGVTRRVRMTAIGLGDLVLLGFPGDFSGELGAALRAQLAPQMSLLPMSFSGAYLGYISPDAYYDELYDDGGLAYETGIMSWTGPHQERFFVSVAGEMVDAVRGQDADGRR